jgi:hypothetical protein
LKNLPPPVLTLLFCVSYGTHIELADLLVQQCSLSY